MVNFTSMPLLNAIAGSMRRHGIAFVTAGCLFIEPAEDAHAQPLAKSAIFARGPWSLDVSDTRASVRVELNVSSAAQIDVRDREGQLTRTLKASPSTFHTFEITGLSAEREHTYEIKVGSESTSGRFMTAPTPDGNQTFSFLLYGDNRTDHAAHEAVVSSMVPRPGAFLIHTGDFVVDGGTPSEWDKFFRIEDSLLRTRAIFSCVGNHELFGDAGDTYVRLFGPTHTTGVPRLYSTMRWSHARFFLLNAFDAAGDGRAWLERELEQADHEQGLRWRFVVIHQGPYSSGPHGGSHAMVRNGLVTLFRRHKIDAILSGHDHLYERGLANDLRYVVTGGGGAPLYPIKHRLESTRKVESTRHFIEVSVTSDHVTMNVQRVDGTLLETCGFGKEPGWDCDPKVAATPPVAPSTAPSTTPSHRGCVSCAIVETNLGRPHTMVVAAVGLGLFLARRYKKRNAAHAKVEPRLR